jgi:threonine/homoserine/homoserine lactone efflux protein
LTDTPWPATLVLAAASKVARHGFECASRGLDRCAGAIMMGFGIKLIATR